MEAIAGPALAAFSLAWLVTPVVRRLAAACGWVDLPDARRKLHRGSTPRAGGAALLASYLGAQALTGSLGNLVPVLPGLALVFGVGLADDRFNLRPSQKLAGEIAAALCVYVGGIRIDLCGGPAWAGVLVTVAWLVLCANAFNLVDGVDGLAAGVGSMAAVAMAAAGVARGDGSLAVAAAPLAAALLGFLRYNFYPASIFLGDCGSLPLGFLLGSCAIRWMEGSATFAAAAPPVIALALPLLEVALSIARRFVRNVPIFAADRGHLHHRLLERGFTPRRVTLAWYAGAALCAGMALTQSSLSGIWRGVFPAVLAVAAWAAMRYLGYLEFGAAGRFLGRRLRPALGAQVAVEALERSLREAGGAADCWRAVETAGRALGYARIDARLAGVRFSSGAAGQRQAWQMRVHLPEGDYVNISQPSGGPGPTQPLAAFVDVVGGVLPDTLGALRSTRLSPPDRACDSLDSSPGSLLELLHQARVPVRTSEPEAGARSVVGEHPDGFQGIVREVFADER